MQDNANSELPASKQIPWNKLMMLFPPRNRSTSDLYVRGRPPPWSECDQTIAVLQTNAIAKSGSTTPASGYISCRGYPATDFSNYCPVFTRVQIRLIRRCARGPRAPTV
jgi:hypothetical protein